MMVMPVDGCRGWRMGWRMGSTCLGGGLVGCGGCEGDWCEVVLDGVAC